MLDIIQQNLANLIATTGEHYDPNTAGKPLVTDHSSMLFLYGPDMVANKIVAAITPASSNGFPTIIIKRHGTYSYLEITTSDGSALPQGLEGSWSSPTVIQRAFDKLLSAKEKAYV